MQQILVGILAPGIIIPYHYVADRTVSQGGDNPFGEGPNNLIDGELATKWVDFNMVIIPDQRYLCDLSLLA